jgi:hypothetical protein
MLKTIIPFFTNFIFTQKHKLILILASIQLIDFTLFSTDLSNFFFFGTVIQNYVRSPSKSLLELEILNMKVYLTKKILGALDQIIEDEKSELILGENSLERLKEQRWGENKYLKKLFVKRSIEIHAIILEMETLNIKIKKYEQFISILVGELDYLANSNLVSTGDYVNLKQQKKSYEFTLAHNQAKLEERKKLQSLDYFSRPQDTQGYSIILDPNSDISNIKQVKLKVLNLKIESYQKIIDLVDQQMEYSKKIPKHIEQLERTKFYHERQIQEYNNRIAEIHESQ